MNQYLIIGNGTAAVGCIEGIRSVDASGKITVISKEKEPAYCRPLISYYLEDRTTEAKMAYRSADFYQKNHCTVHYGTSATAIDASKKTVCLENGAEIPYTKLCLATGSSPFVPPMARLESVENRFSFLTLDDAKRLKQTVTPESRVLIVGAGLIGLKCSEGLRAITKQITVCDLADHVLSSILDKSDAKRVQTHLEMHDIRFYLHNSVERFENNTAILQNGENVPFDIVVTAVGVRANTALFREIGGVCGRGITVNEKMETSVADIYAAGDCTECVDITDGQTKVMALMPNAYMEGFTAGVNMAGGAKVFDNIIPMNAIGFFGLHLMTAGTRTGETVADCTAERVKRLYFNGDRLVGFVLLGAVKNAGIYTNFIRKRLPVEELLKAQMCNTPNMTLYDAPTRKKALEGAV